MNDTCRCELRGRQWNPLTGYCEECGVRYQAHDASREDRKLDAIVAPFTPSGSLDQESAGDLYAVRERPDRFETE